MKKLSIKDLDLTNKRLLIRVDFNVPLSHAGPSARVVDDTRIRETIPTIEYAMRHGAKVILCSHLGRPKGEVVPSLSLRPAADRLAELLEAIFHRDDLVRFASDCVGEAAITMTNDLQAGHCLVLENLRFHKEEERNAPEFAQRLADVCDLYVNDAFGSAHRAHASTEGITHFVSQSAAGLLMESELMHLGTVLAEPEAPFVAIIGGAKVSDKIGVIESLIEKADAILIGGGMAYTFLSSEGQKTGKSLVEEEKLDVARSLRQVAEERGVRFLLPTDHILAKNGNNISD